MAILIISYLVVMKFQLTERYGPEAFKLVAAYAYPNQNNSSSKVF